MEGVADLPLHEGQVPLWLLRLMRKLAKAIVEIFILEHGPGKLVERLANPLWFQAFNNVIGMDWDSSGSTTVTLAILRSILNNGEYGVLVLGGKGSKAKSVPEEINYAVEKLSLPSRLSGELKKASRLVAKVDSALVQDGYSIYIHSLIVSENAKWAIVQQGMNVNLKMARRYHWLSDNLESYIREPHSGILTLKMEEAVLNLVDRDVENARKTIVDLAKENPSTIVNMYRDALNALRNQTTLYQKASIVRVNPVKKQIYYAPITSINTLAERIARIKEVSPRNLEELLLVRGVGASTIKALALISDLIFNEPPSYRDPANYIYDPFRYAFTVGGKDGVPYPVNRKVMEETIATLENTIKEAKISPKDKRRALNKLKTLRAKVHEQ